jgi:tetratricopeptide (TPR) repeat protein
MLLVMAVAGSAGASGPAASPPGDSSALLDSVVTGEIASGPMTVLDISRRRLPDVQASELPHAAAPTRPPRLEDPLDGAYQYHLARSALLGGDASLAAEKIAAATQADPAQPQYRWWQLSLALARWDPIGLICLLPGAVRSGLAHPTSRLRWLLMGQQALLLYIAILWTLLALAYLFSHWSDVAHDLAGLLFRSRRHRLRGWLPWLLPLSALIWRPGWLGALALISIPLYLSSRGRSRLPLALTWAVCSLLLLPSWPWLQRAMPVVDPASETHLLVEADRQATSPELRRRLTVLLEEAQQPDRRQRLQLALAIQKARAGQYEESNQLLREILSSAPDHVAARVDLGNNTYYLGRFDAAAHEYLTAGKLAPRRGEIPYNLAQVYLKKLFLPEASDALEQAQALKFTPPAWEDPTGAANGFSPVVYLGHTDQELVASARFEAPRYPPGAHLAAWRDWLGPAPLPSWLLPGAAILLVLLLTGIRKHQTDRNCRNCGLVICPTCGRIRDGAWLCATCADTADRSRSDLVLATLLKNRSRSLELARMARRSLAARLLPGSGHLASGNILAGTCRLALLALALFMLLFAWSFDLAAEWTSPGLILPAETVHPLWFPLPRAAWPGVTAWPVAGGLVLLLLIYLLAQLDGAALRTTMRGGRFGFADSLREPGPPQPTAFRRTA